jgi:hypothetical protein
VRTTDLDRMFVAITLSCLGVRGTPPVTGGVPASSTVGASCCFSASTSPASSAEPTEPRPPVRMTPRSSPSADDADIDRDAPDLRRLPVIR